jgi:hypothetical protein
LKIFLKYSQVETSKNSIFPKQTGATIPVQLFRRNHSGATTPVQALRCNHSGATIPAQPLGLRYVAVLLVAMSRN